MELPSEPPIHLPEVAERLCGCPLCVTDPLSWMRTWQHQPLSLGLAPVRPVGTLLPKCPGGPLGFVVDEQVIPRAHLGWEPLLLWASSRASPGRFAPATAGVSFTQMSC